jgi:hypothetical protein
MLGRVLVALLLAAALAPVARPFAGPGFPQGHDAVAHLTNTYRFDRAFEQGQFPVRWVEGIEYGRGQPLFNFYQVGFYYLVELGHQLGLRLSTAYRAAPVFLYWLGAAFMYLLLRRPYGMSAAAAGTLAFALSPYLIVDVFVRAAYPECAAIAFAVGTLWAADAFLCTGSRWSLALVAILSALMLVCHLPATLIATPMIAAHVMHRAAVSPAARSHLRWLGAAMGVGIGISMFYLMPALAELSMVGIRRLTQGHGDFHGQFVSMPQSTHFLWSYAWKYDGSSVTDPSNLMPAHVNLVQWAAMLAACGVSVAAILKRRPAAIGGLLTWLSIAVLSIFMMSALAQPVWEALPPLAFIQFPWRFFLLMSVAGGVLVAMLISRLKSRTARIVAFLLIAAVHLHLYERRLRPATYIPEAETQIDQAHWSETMVARRVGFVERAYDAVDVSSDNPVDARWTVVRGSATVQAARTDDAHLVLTVSGAEPSIVRVNTPAFPGWRVSVDGADVGFRQEPGSGYMLVDLQPGTHTLETRFENTPVRRAGNLASLFSLLMLPLLVLGYGGGTARPLAQHRQIAVAERPS